MPDQQTPYKQPWEVPNEKPTPPVPEPPQQQVEEPGNLPPENHQVPEKSLSIKIFQWLNLLVAILQIIFILVLFSGGFSNVREEGSSLVRYALFSIFIFSGWWFWFFFNFLAILQRKKGFLKTMYWINWIGIIIFGLASLGLMLILIGFFLAPLVILMLFTNVKLGKELKKFQ